MDKPKRNLNLDNQLISDELDYDIKKRTFDIQNVPNLKLFNVELDGISGKIRDIKLSNKSIEFINKIQAILDLFDPKDHHYDHNVVLFSMQAVENMFIDKKKCGVIKLKCVIEACKKYFNGDEELITKFVDLLLPKLNKSRLYKLKVYFLKKFGMLL